MLISDIKIYLLLYLLLYYILDIAVLVKFISLRFITNSGCALCKVEDFT